MENIDSIATKIMTEEALKIIIEAYEVIFEGNEKGKTMEEDVQNSGKKSTEKTVKECVEVVVVHDEQEDGNFAPIGERNNLGHFKSDINIRHGLERSKTAPTEGVREIPIADTEVADSLEGCKRRELRLSMEGLLRQLKLNLRLQEEFQQFT